MAEYKARISMKSDTETNWNAATTFVPFSGEIIIYSPDNTHDYSRLKVGDGSTKVSDLPFIDSGTINSKAVEIVKINGYTNFPLTGSPDKLYVDTATNRIYHYDVPNSRYSQLSNFSISTTNVNTSRIGYWSPGIVTELTLENNILKIQNGRLPELTYVSVQAINSVTQG